MKQKINVELKKLKISEIERQQLETKDTKDHSADNYKKSPETVKRIKDNNHKKWQGMHTHTHTHPS